MSSSETATMAKYKAGIQIWRLSGDLYHREDGPAVILPNGKNFWYIRGTPIYNPGHYQAALGISDEKMTELLMTYSFS